MKYHIYFLHTIVNNLTEIKLSFLNKLRTEQKIYIGNIG